MALRLAAFLLAIALLVPAASVRGQAEETAAPPPRTALITGANRGIGLELARQLRAAGWNVIGTARDPDGARALRATGARVERLDVTSAEEVAALAKALDGVAIDLLINNAGTSSGSRAGSIETVDPDTCERVLRVNTVGPLRVVKALLPNLRAGAGKRIVGISSALGSIEGNDRGGFYGYRESKAGLCMLTRSLAAELREEGFVCIAMSPGWVRTDMGGPQATLSPEESVRGMLAVVAKLGPDDNGRFLNHDGETIPW